VRGRPGPPAHLVGYSDGGIVSLHVARRRPDLVRSMVLIGTNYHVDGLMPDWLGDDDDGAMALLQAGYAAVSPDGGDHFPVVVEKTTAMFTTEPRLTADDLRELTMPTLVLVGDDDAIRHEHTVSLFETLPNAQLAVVPGTSHLLPLEKPALVGTLVDDFLAAGGAVSTFLPLRRRAQK
jgi:pimeloyl-ACP methyl ester carboxylesterase